MAKTAGTGGHASNRERGALVQLRAYLTQQDLGPESRLPPERELSKLLGVSRGDLRKAFAILEAEGMIWRRVGKGTFVGPQPKSNLINLYNVAQRSSPKEVMRTRILLEPLIAAEAALNATTEDTQALRRCLANSRNSSNWREYETSDNQLHQNIALATHNSVLIALYEALNSVRRAVNWGILRRDRVKPPKDHHSFADHEAIVSAISARDRTGATRAMEQHLLLVEHRMFELKIKENHPVDAPGETLIHSLSTAYTN